MEQQPRMNNLHRIRGLDWAEGEKGVYHRGAGV